MDKILKDIPNYEGLYAISREGRIFSHPRLHGNGRFYQGKFLKPQTDHTGYNFVNLWRDGKKSPQRVHRLVLLTFVGVPPDGSYANHKNGNRKENNLDNLEWSTPSENNIHAFRVLGRAPVKNFGEKGANKVTDRQIDYMRRLRAGNPAKWTYLALSLKFKIGRSQVCRIINMTSRTHHLP